MSIDLGIFPVFLLSGHCQPKYKKGLHLQCILNSLPSKKIKVRWVKVNLSPNCRHSPQQKPNECLSNIMKRGQGWQCIITALLILFWTCGSHFDMFTSISPICSCSVCSRLADWVQEHIQTLSANFMLKWGKLYVFLNESKPGLWEKSCSTVLEGGTTYFFPYS